MGTASAGTLSVTLAANDRLSPALARVNGIAARVSAGFGHLTKQARGLEALNRIEGSARRVARGIDAIVPPLGAITAAASIAGVIRLVTGFADLGAQLGRTAYRVQMTAGGLSALQGAARIAGTSAEDMAGGLQGLGDAISDAVGGRDVTALQYLTLLGVRMRDASGSARTAGDVLPDVADGIARISDPRLQARVMAALRLPEGMLPFLKRGAEGMREYEREARRLGAVTDEGAVIAARFEKQQSMLRLAGEGLVNTIAQRLAPSIGGLMERMTTWIAANREWLAQKVEQVVLGIASAVERMAVQVKAWIEDGGWERFTTRIEAMASGIGDVVGAMGGWESAILVVGGLLAVNLVAPLATVVGYLAVIAAFRAPMWLLRLVGVGGLAAGGAAALAMRPGGTNAGEREELERQRRDPAALAREMAPARHWSPEASWIERMRNFPGERIVNPIQRGPLAGFPNRAGREAQREARNTGDPAQVEAGRRRTPEEFSREFGPMAQTAARDLGVSPRIVLAQMAIESDYGRAFVGRNNPFNMTAVRGADATEGGDRDGAGNAIRQRFQNFGTAEEAALHYAGRVRRLWPGAVGAGDDVDRFSAGLRFGQQGGYASDPDGGYARWLRVRAGQIPEPPAPPRPAAPARAPAPVSERGEEPMRNPSLPTAATPGPQTQRFDVRVQLAGPGSAGATITTRTPDGGVRIERAALGAIG